MKKTYLKTLVTACVATVSFIYIQNGTAQANSEDQTVKEEITQQIDNSKEERTEVTAIPSSERKLGLKEKEQVSDEFSEPESKAKKTSKKKPEGTLSKEERDLFARLVEAEAKGESYEGKVAVATVVLNRVDSSEFPNTVTGVIRQVVGKTYAFSPVQNGEINKPASSEAKRAVEEALTRKDRLNDSIYFYNPEIATDQWIRSRTVVKTIGSHVFAK